MGNAEWKRRENKVEGKKDEPRKGSGREGGMDGKDRKMLVYLNPSVASLNHGSPVILKIARCSSLAPRF